MYLHSGYYSDKDAAKAIAGAIKNVVDIVMGAVNWFVGLNESTQQLLANIVVGAVAFGPILMIMGKLISAFSHLIRDIRNRFEVVVMLTQEDIEFIRATRREVVAT